MGLAQAKKCEIDSQEDVALPERAMTQAECDAIQAAARQARGACLPLLREVERRAPLEPTDDEIESRLSQELDYAQRLLEAVGDAFVSDPVILERHETTMQSFDIIGQLLGHLAKVVGAKDKHEAIYRIGMQELRSRLKRPVPNDR
jgi:hypothetical protein